MAVYYTDFREYAPDLAPPDWTPLWVTDGTTWAVRANASASGNRELERSGPSADVAGYVWDKAGVSSDTEVLVLVRFDTVAIQLDWAIVRASGVSSANNYAAVYLGTTLYLCVRTAGVLTVLTQMSFPLTAGVLYWTRLRAEGTTITLSVWPDGSAEPGTPMLSATDATHSTGYAGVASRLAYVCWYDRVSIATDNDVAVGSPPPDLRTKLALTSR